MHEIPQISHTRAVRAFEHAGFRIARQGKHIAMVKGETIIIIPRHNPVKSYTLRGIIEDAGLSLDEFRHLI